MDPMEGLRAAMAAVDTYYKERGIFQGRFGFGLCPALAVIDMAYGWTDAAYAGGSERLNSAVAALERLLPAARAKGVPVIYTTLPFSETPPPKSAADFSPNFRRWDRRACDIDERLHPLPGEYVLYKEHARQGLLKLQRRHPQVGDVRGLGLMVAMDLVKEGDRQAPDPALRDAAVQAAFHQGLLLLGCGESAIRFCPPLCVTAEQVDTVLEILDGVLAERPLEKLAV